jgi:hypothetical protein
MKNQEKLEDLVNNLERGEEGGVKSKGIKERKSNPKRWLFSRKKSKPRQGNEAKE